MDMAFFFYGLGAFVWFVTCKVIVIIFLVPVYFNEWRITKLRLERHALLMQRRKEHHAAMKQGATQ